MSYQHPFQKICYVSRRLNDVLLGAAGPNIYSLDPDDGSILSIWPNNDNPVKDSASIEANGERPAKRQKRDVDAEESSRDNSLELQSQKTESAQGERSQATKSTNSTPSNISHLISTKDGKYILAITAEDKSLRVFELQESGELKGLTQRAMPKRACALVLTPDEKTILMGDKFGDVYALPLHPSDRPVKKPSQPKSAPFKPSASEFTVHTQGNLNALRQQQMRKLVAKTKTGPDFEHQLILGHVSLLTDVLAVDLPSPDGNPKGYILSSDRDEHIRVSRGIPQAHIIETYCLNHLDFVSKLCVLPWQPDLLVAGSGEPSLKCFSWPTGELLYNAFGTGDEVEELLIARPDLRASDSLDVRFLKLAVSGIWPMQYFAAKYEAASHSQDSGFVIVAMEGIPAIFVYRKTFNKSLSHHTTLRLPGNALDLAVLPDQRSIIVSIDTIHAPGSVRRARLDSETQPPAFVAFTYTSQPKKRHPEGHDVADDPIPLIKWQESTHLVTTMNKALDADDIKRGEVDVSKWEGLDSTSTTKGTPKEKRKLYSPLGEFLYGLENLRKRSYEDRKKSEQEDEDDELAAEAPVVPGKAES